MKLILFIALFNTFLFLAHAEEDLNNIAGKVFDINLKEKSFRFLKQDVPINDKGEQTQAWYKVYWSDDAVFMQHNSLRNLSTIKGSIVTIFTDFDANNAKALKAGETFFSDKMILRPDLKEASGISADGKQATFMFTPRPARFSRDGTVKINGKDVKAGVKRGGIRITLQEYYKAEDFAKGFWKVTLMGKNIDGKFVANELRLNKLKNPLEADDPKLPRVLSVGDSISMNYEQEARKALQGVANYHRIEDNCWSTFRGMTFISYWMGDYKKKGLHWDVIHFNSGLHDMKKKKLDGEYAVPLDVYKKNLRKEIEIMKQSGAKLIFCTTTPVQNDSGSPRYAYRSKGAEKDFNKAALEVLKDYPEIQVNDLAKAIDESPVFDKWRKGRDVHFYKGHEKEFLGKKVAEAVTMALKK